MRESSSAPHKNLFLTLTVVLLAWGTLGTLDVPRLPFTGYTTDANNNVIQVVADGPAAAAGMRTGDRVTSIAGVSVEDVRGLNALDRGEIGATRAFVVARGGSEVSLDVRFTAQPSGAMLGAYFGVLVGACFLLFGLWAYVTAPNAGTALLALTGVLFGPAFLAGPHITSASMRTIVGLIVLPAVLMGFSTMLGFVLRSGRPDGYSDTGGPPRWIYVPAFAVALLFIWLIGFKPAATGTLNNVVRIVVGLFFVGYFGACLVVVIRNYLKAGADVRVSRGLGLMLGGTVIGLLPGTLATVVSLLSPSTVIPTSQYWFLALIAVPITFAMAALRANERGSVR